MIRSIYHILIGLCVIFYSCTKEFTPNTTNVTEIENSIVSDRQKSAVKNLESMLAAIDSAMVKTRGYSDLKEIKNVEVVRNIMPTTRISTKVDSLLFIVNFKDEKGYAILGANDYIDDVLAIVDNGNLSADEFLFSRSVNLDADAHMLHEHILNYTLRTIKTNSMQHTIQGYYPIDGWNLSIIVPAMLTTTWHQYPPYNMYCPQKNGQHCLAGCVAIAAAQIIAYNKLTYGIGVDKLATYKLNWSGIFDEMENPGTNVAAAAMLIRAVGKCVLTDYGLSGSSSDIYRATYAFASMEYFYLRINDYATKHAYKTVVDRRIPAYTRGVCYDSNGKKVGGHAWVIDGYYKYQRAIYDKPYDPFNPFVEPPKVIGTETHHLVHCNFGWANGTANGYYLSGIFDLEDGAKELDPGSQPTNISTWKDMQIMDYQLDI